MHVAIIMNGNGRWALRRGLSPAACRTEGAAALRATVDSALQAGVKTLTLYALSSTDLDSFPHEIDADLTVLRDYLYNEGRRCAERSVRISLIGRGTRLSAERLRSALEGSGCPADASSHATSRMHLRMVIDYSAHDSVVQSTRCGAQRPTPESFAQRVREIDPTALAAGAVDLLIRTGGGRCRSEFMLWEVAYARVHHADCLWPDFTAHDFQRALYRLAACEPFNPL